MGKIEGDRYTCYDLAVYDQNEEPGYLRFNYQNNGIAQLYVDYPDTMIVYTLDHGYMPQETLERKLQKFGVDNAEVKDRNWICNEENKLTYSHA